MGKFLLTVLACGIAMWVALPSCSSKNEESIDSFLQENDPATKATRDRWIAAIKSQEKKLDELQRSSRKYESESAQNEFAREINRVESEISRLSGKLKELDEKVEMAMLARDFERADAAGMNSEEAREVLESSGAAIEKADQLNSDIRDSMGDGRNPQPQPRPKQIQRKVPPKAVVVSYAPPKNLTAAEQIRELDQEIISRASKLVKVQSDIEKMFSEEPMTLTRGSNAYRRYEQLSLFRYRLEMELADLRAKRAAQQRLSKR